jgi:hypothetical protein
MEKESPAGAAGDAKKEMGKRKKEKESPAGAAAPAAACS